MGLLASGSTFRAGVAHEDWARDAIVGVLQAVRGVDLWALVVGATKGAHLGASTTGLLDLGGSEEVGDVYLFTTLWQRFGWLDRLLRTGRFGLTSAGWPLGRGV